MKKKIINFAKFYIQSITRLAFPNKTLFKKKKNASSALAYYIKKVLFLFV